MLHIHCPLRTWATLVPLSFGLATCLIWQRYFRFERRALPVSVHDPI